MDVIIAETGELRLVSITGPSPVSFVLKPPGPITLGRRATNTVELRDRLVSREHARLACRPVGTDARSSAGQWLLTDLNSRHGTFLNGRPIVPGEPMPVRGGDIVIIAPWTFRLEGPSPTSQTTFTAQTVDDSHAGTAAVTPVQPRGMGAIAQQRLALLLQCAEELHGVADEQALARFILDAAVGGTGFANAAVLHPMKEDGQIDIIEYRGAVFHASTGPTISRSLVEQAASGQPARLSRMGGAMVTTQSIVDLRIEEALCVPVQLEASVVQLLYLDDRGGAGMVRTPDAADFAIGLARLAGMALANLRRLEVERRQARVEAELSAAAEAQRWIVPRRNDRLGAFTCIGECRPGQYVGGDFFDVIALDDGRVAVALGDVSGKGIAASVLMTAAQGFLHAALKRSGDPAKAVNELNQYLCPRCPSGRFLSLWVGVFDSKSDTVSYVDAGHGYAMLFAGDVPPEPLTNESAGLLGIYQEARYEAVVRPLAAAGRAFILSDGLLEQFGAEPESSDEPGTGLAAGADSHAFGMDGVCRCISNLPPEADPVEALFAAVADFAGTASLADDATALVVGWG